jgi:hypothetical protein
MPKIVKVTVSPVRLLNELERAANALPHDHQCPATRAVHYAVEKLSVARAAQDLVLDASTRLPESPAPRVVPPQYPGVEP